jgi:hypothetical protein
MGLLTGGEVADLLCWLVSNATRHKITVVMLQAAADSTATFLDEIK